MAIITISRGTFSQGQILAEDVAKTLAYRCVGKEVLKEAAEQYGIAEGKLSDAIIKSPGAIEHLHSEKKQYLACLRAALMLKTKNDDVVYHWHAGHLLLQGAVNLLRVRLIANMESRVNALIAHNNLSREEAVRFIKGLDEERVRWTRFFYHLDWRDSFLYDVTINLDHVSLPGACDIICQAAHMKQCKVNEESQKAMDDLALSCHLEALIANNRSISGGKNVRITADGGIVTIEGAVASIMDADKVRLLVRKTPGVKEINSRMRVSLWGIPTRQLARN